MTTDSTSFSVSWSSSDGAGSGIASYDVDVSGNGGPFAPVSTDTTLTSTTFTGQVGHTYAFYGVATSNVGIVQPTPNAAQATTLVVAPPPPPVVMLTDVSEKSNKKHQVTQMLVALSGAVNASEADQIGAYHQATPGKQGSYTAINAGVIKLRSAVYEATSDTAELTSKRPFALTKPVELIVFGTGSFGLQDSYGRLIYGRENVSAILSNRGVTIAAVRETPAKARGYRTAAAVDHLLEQHALVIEKGSSHRNG